MYPAKDLGHQFKDSVSPTVSTCLKLVKKASNANAKVTGHPPRAWLNTMNNGTKPSPLLPQPSYLKDFMALGRCGRLRPP
jgi:hypothetical protein